MNRFILRILALAGLLAIVGRAESATTLISCSPAGSGTDSISHGFYIPNYPGVSLRSLTMSVSSDRAETFVFTLTAHASTFDGPVLGSATREIALAGDATSPVELTFAFGGSSAMPAPKGRAVAFVLKQQGTTSSYPANLFFAAGAAGSCGAVETDDSSPPLSAIRGSVPVTVTGDLAPVSRVPNSTFDTGVGGWLLSPTSTAAGTLSFSPADANGSPTSGSALVTNTSKGFFEVRGCAQDLLPGVYTWGGKIRFSSPTPASTAMLQVAASSTPDCSNPTGLYFLAAPGDGLWHATSGFGIPVGPGTNINIRSLSLVLTIASDALGTPVQAYFDDVFVRPAQLSTLTVLGAASIHGQAGSFFHTDLWVLNRSFTETIVVTPRFRCSVGIGCGAVNLSPFWLAPREQRLFADVVGNRFLSPEVAGIIELSWDLSLGSISAWARTFSPTAPAPTNGTGIPALASTDARARSVFIGLGSNGGNLGAGFRSNVGAYNPSLSTATATFSLFDDSGRLLGAVNRTIAGFEAFQFNDIFAVVGAGSTVASRASLVLTSDVPIFSFVTVIDNQTNDSSFLLPTDDETAP